MRILKLPLAGLLFCVMALFAGCKTSNEPKAPVALTWEMGPLCLLYPDSNLSS